ncbi:MAG: hypothetical protein ABI461_05325, partial [Polyangiaceae bacterium]
FPAPCNNPRVIIDGLTTVTALAGDDNGVYVSDDSGGAVFGCSDTKLGCGTTPTTMATDLSHPRGIAIDNKFIFVAQSGAAANTGKVTRIVR